MTIKAGVFKCSVCGTNYEMNEVLSLTIRQRGIRDAITRLRRDYGRPVKTIEICNYLEGQGVNYPVGLSTVKNELCYLESRRIVHRPNGEHSGWDLKDANGIAMVRVA